jgi:hypothetical protein
VSQAPFVRGELVGVIGYVIRDMPGVGCKVGLVRFNVCSMETWLRAVACDRSFRCGFRAHMCLAHVFQCVVQLMLSTASDLKGSIPQMAVNFVAKRTPIKWIDRLKRMVTERYMGHPPVDTSVRIRDWHPK